MSARHNLRVFGITGAGYSGKTLLSFMLGSHQSVFATGESYQLFGRYRQVSGRRRLVDMCSVHHESCGFWTRSFVEKCNNSNITDLHRHIAKTDERASVVVHAFNLNVYRELLEEKTQLHGLLVMFKRPIANYCSRKAHEGEDVKTSAANYVSTYREIQDFSESSRIPVAAIFYEDLANNPEETVRTLSAWMEIPYDPTMKRPWDAVDRLHTIGGNAGTYMHLWDDGMRDQMLNSPYWRDVHGERARVWLMENLRSIRLDERWKSLPTNEVRELEADSAACETFEALMARRLLPDPRPGRSALTGSAT